jgi:hypothetical protein
MRVVVAGGVLVLGLGASLVVACSSGGDGGQDAGADATLGDAPASPDTGSPDTGSPDTASPDTGAADGGDAAAPDAGGDGGVADAGADVVDAGCDANLSGDPTSCGACGNVCPAGGANTSPVCVDAGCGAACNAGFGDCDQDASSGCEIDLGTTLAHCGACGKPCTVANGTPACQSGKCTVASCQGTFRDCNTDAGDGCEINVASNTTHCGACNKPCNLANAIPLCNNGLCAIAACGANFGNCDNNVANGCETDLATSVQHCGGCNKPCAMNQMCVAGKCQ